jgi:hypothetical protein
LDGGLGQGMHHQLALSTKINNFLDFIMEGHRKCGEFKAIELHLHGIL